jgi:hypothetical protein
MATKKISFRYAYLAPEHKRSADELLDGTAGSKSASRFH